MLISDAVLLGGGLGRRYHQSNDGLAGPESELPKQFQLLEGLPVFLHSFRALRELGCFRQFVLVVPSDYIALAERLIGDSLDEADRRVLAVVAGGRERYDSSKQALLALERLNPTPPSRVAIHDACRPFLSGSFLARLKAAIDDRSYAAWIPAVPVVETVKRVENRQIVETIDRSQLVRVQTPQVFEYDVIRSLIEKVAAEPDLKLTDDASVCETYGIPVGMFVGDERNIKLTYGFEMEILRALLRAHKPGTETPCELGSATTFTV